jgi:hypothetical protein
MKERLYFEPTQMFELYWARVEEEIYQRSRLWGHLESPHAVKGQVEETGLSSSLDVKQS